MKKKSILLRNSLIIIHVLFAIVGLFTYLASYNISEKLLVQKTQSKQFVLAKAGSLAVDSLLKNVQLELSSFIFSFNKVEEKYAIDKDLTRAGFIAYMQRAQLPINGIALFDEQGKAAILENRYHIQSGEGEDFSKAGFIKWSKDPANKGKTFISTPLVGTIGASKDKIILIVAEPIYFGDNYKGTLVIRLLVDDFTKTFVTPLNLDSNEETFIINTNGVVIAGRNTLLNRNLFSYAKQRKWNQSDDFINKLNQAIKKGDAQTSWVFQQPQEQPKVMLIGISKIDIPDSDIDMYMIVTTPESGVIDLLSVLKRYGYFWLGFGVMTTIIGSLIVIKLEKKS